MYWIYIKCIWLINIWGDCSLFLHFFHTVVLVEKCIVEGWLNWCVSRLMNYQFPFSKSSFYTLLFPRQNQSAYSLSSCLQSRNVKEDRIGGRQIEIHELHRQDILKTLECSKSGCHWGRDLYALYNILRFYNLTNWIPLNTMN